MTAPASTATAVRSTGRSHGPALVQPKPSAALTLRAWFVVLHRWSGLTITVFLVIAGLTGSVLPFRDELTYLSAPRLFGLDAKLELDADFLKEESPFEWGGVYQLEAGEYRFRFEPGADAEMDFTLLPLSSAADEAFALAQRTVPTLDMAGFAFFFAA